MWHNDLCIPPQKKCLFIILYIYNLSITQVFYNNTLFHWTTAPPPQRSLKKSLRFVYFLFLYMKKPFLLSFRRTLYIEFVLVSKQLIQTDISFCLKKVIRAIWSITTQGSITCQHIMFGLSVYFLVWFGITNGLTCGTLSVVQVGTG